MWVRGKLLAAGWALVSVAGVGDWGCQALASVAVEDEVVLKLFVRAPAVVGASYCPFHGPGVRGELDLDDVYFGAVYVVEPSSHEIIGSVKWFGGVLFWDGLDWSEYSVFEVEVCAVREPLDRVGEAGVGRF